MILKVTAHARCPHCGKPLRVNLDLQRPEDTWIDACTHCTKSVQFQSVLKDGKLKVSTEQRA